MATNIYTSYFYGSIYFTQKQFKLYGSPQPISIFLTIKMSDMNYDLIEAPISGHCCDQYAATTFIYILMPAAAIIAIGT